MAISLFKSSSSCSGRMVDDLEDFHLVRGIERDFRVLDFDFERAFLKVGASESVGGGAKVRVGARERDGVVGVRRELWRWRWRSRTKKLMTSVSRM